MRRIRGRAWLLALISGALQVLIFPSPSLSFLCWVALAPLFVAVLDPYRRFRSTQQSAMAEPHPSTWWHGFLLAYISGLIWYAGSCYWLVHSMHVYGGVSTAGSLGILALFCIVAALHHGALGLLLALSARSRRHALRNALLLSPFLWVAVELLRDRFAAFPWDLLGTVQVGNIAVTRIAVVTGVYGISFEIALVNAALATAMLLPGRVRTRLLLVSIAIAVLLEAGRLVQPAPAPHDRTATLVQADIPILPQERWTAEYFLQTLSSLRDTTLPAMRTAEREHGLPGFAIWPEAPAPFLTSEPIFREAVSQLAREAQGYILVVHIGEGTPKSATELARVYNSATVIGPAGEWSARYDKIHLVPFGEYVPFRSLLAFAGELTKQIGEFTPGSERRLLRAGNLPLGVFICYESIFPDEVRQFASMGAEVFVNVSDDAWFGPSGAPRQHLNMVRMRAIENRRWVLRSTNTGITAVIDPLGRVVATAPREQRVALNAPYGVIRETTIYTRYGDVFAWACVIISVAGLIAVFFYRPTGRLRWSKS
jgi:apolipoprotein N-acyltransferase